MVTTEHEMATAIASEIGKQVPVRQIYEDAASPAAKQIGATFEDVVKVIRLVGFPIQWLAIQQDKFRSFIERAKDPVPDDRRVFPAPQLLGPILEGIKYEINETPVVEMFEALLGCAMDSDRLMLAHPAYPSLIANLSSDEARLLRRMKRSPYETYYVRPDPETTELISLSGYPEIEHPDEINFYLEHLIALGLVSQYADSNDDHCTIIDGSWATPIVFRLTPFGVRFMQACTRQD